VVADRVGETPIFLAGLHRAERVIAERLLRLAKGSLPWPTIDVEKALLWVAERLGLSLAESQSAKSLAAATSWQRRSSNANRLCCAISAKSAEIPRAIRADFDPNGLARQEFQEHARPLYVPPPSGLTSQGRDQIGPAPTAAPPISC
jgi:hypothetical protein